MSPLEPFTALPAESVTDTISASAAVAMAKTSLAVDKLAAVANLAAVKLRCLVAFSSNLLTTENSTET